MEDSVATALVDEAPARRVDPSAAIGWSFAIAAHVALGVTALTIGERVRDTSEPTMAVRIDHVVDLAEPEVAEPPPPPPPAAEPPRVREANAEPTAQEAAPALAAAAEVVAAAEAAETLDFEDAIVTGNAASFAGGTTHTAGTSSSHVDAPGATTNGTGGNGTAEVASSRARRAAPRGWRCNLSSSGDYGDGNLAVTLRVEVDASGRASEVTVVSAPDSRIGDAAATCARRIRYDAARDESGAAIASTLTAMRVRLTAP